jgi:hypothetical protein
MPRTNDVLNAATFGRTEKHEKSEQKMIMLGIRNNNLSDHRSYMRIKKKNKDFEG